MPKDAKKDDAEDLAPYEVKGPDQKGPQKTDSKGMSADDKTGEAATVIGTDIPVSGHPDREYGGFGADAVEDTAK